MSQFGASVAAGVTTEEFNTYSRTRSRLEAWICTDGFALVCWVGSLLNEPCVASMCPKHRQFALESSCFACLFQSTDAVPVALCRYVSVYVRYVVTFLLATSPPPQNMSHPCLSETTSADVTFTERVTHPV